ncbi:hypothetical protein HK097_011226 [Rhizophlyctis rosea]|uniref:Mitochondrial fission process protein 1 n=1 Tax=Rhizophlyctis rosea TaxID=64517 RepID=A0AAD5WZC9_9FUNG|nr:hypothetical protein HK097_011226 [Rhizophlyctis rosea]
MSSNKNFSTTTTTTLLKEAEDLYPIDKPATSVVTDDPQTVDTTETPLRFLGYAARLRNIATAGSRYLAYTSDVGEAFRPIVTPWIVNAGYAISFAYVGADVAFEGYKAVKRNEPNTLVTRTVLERGTFQLLASLALPAFIIHSVVDGTAKLLKNRPKTAFIKWAPTAAGLAVVPLLPVLLDKPVETVVEKVFETLWPAPHAHHLREDMNKQDTHSSAKGKEKEL